MTIIIETIPHAEQRYPTVGDWRFKEMKRTFYPSHFLHITVSETGNDDSNFAVAIHEMIEAYACMKAGITQEQVDEFDKEYAKKYPSEEPGDNENAPYLVQHEFASTMERMVIEYLAFANHERLLDRVYEGK